MRTGYLVCKIYICKMSSTVTFYYNPALDWNLWRLIKNCREWTCPAFLPLSLGNLLFLLPPLAFDGVITVHFVKSSRVPGKVYDWGPQKPSLCRCLPKSLVACKSREECGDHGSCFCGVRSTPGCNNWAKGMQILMVSGWGCLYEISQTVIKY